MARRKQLSAWQKRNAAAQAKGFKNYYDYRAHDYGRIAPDKPRATGALLRRLRGHATRADLIRTTRTGDILTMGAIERDPQSGRYISIRIDRIEDDGTETSFWLTGGMLTDDELEHLTDELDDAGGRFLLWYPSTEVKAA